MLYNWIKGNTSYWWLVQKAAIESWLHDRGVTGQAHFREQVLFLRLYDLIEEGPVILQTEGMAGPKGHIILAVGYEDKNILCHDSFGDARTEYKSHSGIYVVYPESWLKKYTGDTVNCMYWRA